MSKRGSIYSQGKPEDPYNEREDAPADPPKQATAAQLAARKLKTARPLRRPAGMTSGLSSSPAPNTFGDLQPPSSFGGFGGENSNNNNNNNNNAASTGMFGSLAQPSQNGGGFGTGTNSFPPTQPSAQSSVFANSSFPTPSFGGNDASTGFNPQPPSSSFNFTSTVSNPFAQNAPEPAAATNGSGGGGFGSIFNTPSTQPQPQGFSNPFSGLAQNNAPTAAPSGLFGANSAPQNTTFGAKNGPQSSIFGTNNTPQNPSFGTPGTDSNTLALTAPAPLATQDTKPVPWGVTQPSQTQQSGAGLQSTGFGSFGSPASNNFAAPSAPASAPASASLFGNSATPSGFDFQGTANKGSTGASGTFKFPATSTPSTTGPSSTSIPMASTDGASKSDGGKTTTAEISSLFGGTTPKASASSGTFSSAFGASTQAQPLNTPATAGNMFNTNTTAEKDSTPAQAGNTFGSMFGGATAKPQTNSAGSTQSKTTQDRTTNPFGGFNTSTQPESTSTQNPFESKSSPATSLQAPTTGLFAQPAAPAASPFPTNTFTPQKSESSKAQSFSFFDKKSEAESPKPDAAQKPAFAFPSQNFSSTASEGTKDAAASTPTLSNLFDRSTSTSKDSAPLSPASAMPTLTGAVAPPPKVAETPSIPKMRAPQNWSALSGVSNDLTELTKHLAFVNNNYRTKLANLPLTADWSSLSRWHMKETSDIMKQITDLKKKTAAAKGITGNESSLSVKRKADEEVSRGTTREGSPTKKQRAGDAPSTPSALKSSSLMGTTPKASPPASLTSNTFLNAINKGTSSNSAGSEKNPEPVNTPASQSTSGSTNAAGSSKENLFQSPFQVPKSHATGSKSGFQVPNFGNSSTPSSGGSTNFMAQFGKAAKTAEQMRAERKAKDKDEDYDSDEETEEAWSTRWDKQEAERVANEKEKLKATTAPMLKVPPPQKTTTDAPSGSSIFQSVSGASSPGLFGSRTSSPAPSNGGGNSVFDTPAGGTTPAQSNIFGHLSSAQSSNNQDDEDDEHDEGDEEERGESQSRFEQQLKAAGSIKRKFDDETESESDEFLEDVMRRKKQNTTKKPALIDRITRADPSEIEASESEKENNKPSAITSIFEKSNGVQTPAPKAKFSFDFAAAGGQTAPPKQNSFAGDQTFKIGTPIKFGSATKAPEGAPTFQFQPPTPSAADVSTTPSKPPPSTFAFLNASNDQSGSGSAVSSRAPTPISEAGSSRGSAAGDDDEEPKLEQLNLSALTEEEKAEHDVLFSTEQAVAKHQVTREGEKKWESYARGALYVLKNKETGRAIVRMRLSSGATRLNYTILPKLETKLAGDSKKMVAAMGRKEDGKPFNLFFCFRSSEIAQVFSSTYNENVQ